MTATRTQRVAPRGGRGVPAFLLAHQRAGDRRVAVDGQATDQRRLAHAGLAHERGRASREQFLERVEPATLFRADAQHGIAQRRELPDLGLDRAFRRQVVLVHDERPGHAGRTRGAEIAVHDEEVRLGEGASTTQSRSRLAASSSLLPRALLRQSADRRGRTSRTRVSPWASVSNRTRSPHTMTSLRPKGAPGAATRRPAATGRRVRTWRGLQLREAAASAC